MSMYMIEAEVRTFLSLYAICKNLGYQRTLKQSAVTTECHENQRWPLDLPATSVYKNTTCKEVMYEVQCYDCDKNVWVKQGRTMKKWISDTSKLK